MTIQRLLTSAGMLPAIKLVCPVRNRLQSVRRRLGRFRGRDGFTLIEALVAFVVLALFSIAVQRVLIVSRTGLVRAEDRILAERVARTLLDAPLGPEASRLGVRSGVSDGCNWTITIEALNIPSQVQAEPSGQAPTNARPAVTWRPIRMTVRVARGSGSALQVETVRLARIGA
jgi:hypothetical protein